MGIYNVLKRVSNGITDKEWQEVYKETLIALENYPFADKVVAKIYAGKKYYQAECAKERGLVPLHEGKGWHVIGDLDTCQYAESFVLVADNNYYNRSQDEGNKVEDILECITNNKPYVTVWDSKTQGEPYHIPLLAIACLVEDRLAGKAIVQGNIRKFEIEEACKWINKYVDRPVKYPVVADPKNLINRLKKIHHKVEDQLKHFFDLYIDILDKEIREVLVQVLGKEILDDYYKKQLIAYQVDTQEFIQVAEQMMQIGYSLKETVSLFLGGKDRRKGEVVTFIQHILRQKINVYFPPKDEVYIAGNVEGQMVFMFDALLGYKRNQYQLSDEERDGLVNMLKQYFAEYVADIDRIAAEAKAYKEEKEKMYEKYLEVLNTAMDQQREYVKLYDIVGIDELVDWEKGDTIAPDVERQLKGIIDLLKMTKEGSCSLKQIIGQLRDKKRLDYMLREETKKFLLPQTFWEYIDQNEKNDRLIIGIAILLRIDVSAANTYKLVKCILCNPALLEGYILKQLQED